MQAIAYRDGTVVLNSTCGHSRTTVRLDVCKAAQLSTGIWEAAGAAQQLTGGPGGDAPSPPQPPPGSEDPPEIWHTQAVSSEPIRARSPRRRRRLPSVNQDGATDARRTLGLRIRRIRHARNKSLQAISGLAGMSSSTLHHIEHGRRDLTLSEITALANALQTDPTKLIILPIVTATSR
ncbi:MAG: helix-turn-helix domain-containing protein [Actinobacteria bacterium]|nr:helix-turn-helix domain-containing protein [Actinomycetota bacterium]